MKEISPICTKCNQEYSYKKNGEIFSIYCPNCNHVAPDVDSIICKYCYSPYYISINVKVNNNLYISYKAYCSNPKCKYYKYEIENKLAIFFYKKDIIATVRVNKKGLNFKQSSYYGDWNDINNEIRIKMLTEMYKR